MPIPSRKKKTIMHSRSKMTKKETEQGNKQEKGTTKDMQTMEPSGHIKARTIN